MQKKFAILLTHIMFIGLFSFVTIEVVTAQSVDKISAPEITTLTYTNNSYNVPASIAIDPFTGKPIENPAYNVDNRTLQFIIKNNISYNSGYLNYLIRMKGSFTNDWADVVYFRADDTSSLMSITFSSSRTEGHLSYNGNSFYLPLEGEADFQVQAQIWGEVMADITPNNPFGGSVSTLFAESDWSKTCHLSLGSISSVEPPILPNQTNSQTDENLTGFNLIVLGLSVTLCLLMVSIVFVYKKRFLPKKSIYGLS
ncbi:MAG: hypothetical protein FWH37_09500 [Candidatus Bathyarchaeota archaeon]|nr:hypothetical protein [Candidatus Termiticorpusculum sp.]